MSRCLAFMFKWNAFHFMWQRVKQEYFPKRLNQFSRVNVIWSNKFSFLFCLLFLEHFIIIPNKDIRDDKWQCRRAFVCGLRGYFSNCGNDWFPPPIRHGGDGGSGGGGSGSLFLGAFTPRAVIAFVFGSAPIYPSQLFPICQDLLYEDREAHAQMPALMQSAASTQTYRKPKGTKSNLTEKKVTGLWLFFHSCQSNRYYLSV